MDEDKPAWRSIGPRGLGSRKNVTGRGPIESRTISSFRFRFPSRLCP